LSATIDASRRRNRQSGEARRIRWRPVRQALLRFLERHAPIQGAVLVVGAGNCDDLPLAEMALRASRVDLLDHDVAAPRAAAQRLPATTRGRVRCIEGDLTCGWADRVVAAARRGEVLSLDGLSGRTPLGEGRYDLVIGDLLYSQLLYPALADAGIDRTLISQVCTTVGRPLTRFAVRRLHAASASGRAVHVHDPLLWTRGREQTVDRNEVFTLVRLDPEAARALVEQGVGPRSFDPRRALLDEGGAVHASSYWRWPFIRGTDYLIEATVGALPAVRPACRPTAESAPPPAGSPSSASP
jgi:hypothetical protein